MFHIWHWGANRKRRSPRDGDSADLMLPIRLSGEASLIHKGNTLHKVICQKKAREGQTSVCPHRRARTKMPWSDHWDTVLWLTRKCICKCVLQAARCSSFVLRKHQNLALEVHGGVEEGTSGVRERLIVIRTAMVGTPFTSL